MFTDMWRYPFMVNAFQAGTVVAIMAGIVGWFVVTRRQAFAAHTVAAVGFPGAAGAVVVGLSVQIGYVTACVAAALVIGLVRHGAVEMESGLVATVHALALASGYLFTVHYDGYLSGTSSLLFGALLGISSAQVVGLVLTAAVVLMVIAAIGRPLLFSSVDPSAASAYCVPVQQISLVFMTCLGVAVAAVSQVTGSLMIFALLVVPAATAQLGSHRPLHSMALTVGIALAVIWVSLVIAYYTDLPVGFIVASTAVVPFLAMRWRSRIPSSVPRQALV